MYIHGEAWQRDVTRRITEAFFAAGAPGGETVLAPFRDRYLKMLGGLQSEGRAIPDALYDFTRAGRIVARRKQMPLPEALKVIADQPTIIFEINGVTPLKTFWRKPDLLSLDDIRVSAEDFFKANKRRPTHDDGLIEYGPLKDSGMTWMTLHGAFRIGFRGLHRYDFKTLADFLNYSGIGDRTLSLSVIEASARATLYATGKRPRAHDKDVLYGPLAGVLKWRNIEAAFLHGNRGLKNSGYKSLAQFLNARGVPRELIGPRLMIA